MNQLSQQYPLTVSLINITLFTFPINAGNEMGVQGLIAGKCYKVIPLRLLGNRSLRENHFACNVNEIACAQSEQLLRLNAG